MKTLNKEKSSESEGDIIPSKKCSQLIILSSDDEEIS